MSKRGKCPSLIGSNAGAVKPTVAKGKRGCHRCDEEILKGEKCFEVGIPNTMGHKNYCLSCMGEIVIQTQKDLEKIKQLAE
ncbi:MAG TPA: hypothetical protein VI728_01065 [Syntrophales bacterium]|nr:hypothetical protein [Syntrophales bacterium]